jgi:predicted nucleic acid-binding protein
LLQELLYVYSSRGERKKGLDVVENILILFPNPLIVRKPEIEKAKDFMRKYRNLSPRDAVHCAVIVNYGLEGIISVDKDFDSVREIQRFMP